MDKSAIKKMIKMEGVNFVDKIVLRRNKKWWY